MKFAGDLCKSAIEHCTDCADQLSRLINVKRISIDGSTQLQVPAENTIREFKPSSNLIASNVGVKLHNYVRTVMCRRTVGYMVLLTLPA